MKKLEKILVATDFSQAAEQALMAAVDLAAVYQSEIVLLHVTPYVDDDIYDLKMARQNAEKHLEELARRADGEGRYVKERIAESGNPLELICQYADNRDVNLVMIGSRGSGDESEQRLGVTAAKILRKADKPVWVVKQGGGPKVKRILCAVDFSRPSHQGLENAVHLARDLGARLDVLTVIEPLPSLHGATYGDTSYYEKRQANRFDHFVADVDFHDIKWEKVVRHGKPHREILDSIAERQADLVIMGSTGRSGLERLLMGSVAEKVTRDMPASVLIVKSEDAIRWQVEEEVADVETRFAQGEELLAEGFTMEAIRQFEYCVGKDMMFLAAWKRLVEAYERLGREEKAEQCRKQAEFVVQKMWQRQVEAEIRGEVWRDLKRTE